MAAAGGQFFDHFADVTGATRTPTARAGSSPSFAERAYRRPLTGPELDSLRQELSDLAALGSAPQELAQYGVYAVLMAPQFIYRTEFGAQSPAAGATASRSGPTSWRASSRSCSPTDPPDARCSTPRARER